jgi:phage terminase large subunit-like protein
MVALLSIISSWDFAAKAKQTNDHTVGLMVGKCGSDFYYLGLYRKRVEFVDAKKDYIMQCEKYKPYKRYVEDTSNGIALISEMAATQYKMTPVSPGGIDKVARVNPITPIIEAGHFHLPLASGFVTMSISGKPTQIYIDADLVDLFVNECANFPLSKEDDVVDALSQLLNNERQSIRPMMSFVKI